MAEKVYTQPEAATILGFKNYRSLNKLCATGKIECLKRGGRNGRKLFTERHISDYLRSIEI